MHVSASERVLTRCRLPRQPVLMHNKCCQGMGPTFSERKGCASAGLNASVSSRVHRTAISGVM
jgi:hypothetical protein